MPDPRFSSRHLFGFIRLDAPIPQFVAAMKAAGIEVTAQQVVQGITFTDESSDGAPLIDYKGDPYIVAIYNLDRVPGQTSESFALLIAQEDNQGNWKWERPSISRVFGLKGKELQVRAEPGGGKQMEGLNEFEDWQVCTTFEGYLYPKERGGDVDYHIPDWFAENTKNRVIGGQLAWGYEPALPSWVIGLSSQDLRIIAIEHIRTVMSRFYRLFGDKKFDWIVAAESTNPTLFAKKLGANDPDYEYIVEQYQVANEVMMEFNRKRGDSMDRLAYSDFINGLNDPKLARIMGILKTLKSHDLIDVFCLQLRFVGAPNLDARKPPTEKQLKELADSIFRETEVKVIFSEIGITGGKPEPIYAATALGCIGSEGCIGLQYYSVGEAEDGDNESPLFDYKGQTTIPNRSYYRLMTTVLLSSVH